MQLKFHDVCDGYWWARFGEKGRLEIVEVFTSPNKTLYEIAVDGFHSTNNSEAYLDKWIFETLILPPEKIEEETISLDNDFI